MTTYNPLDPAFVPSTDVTSVGFGLNTLAGITSGIHNTAIGNSALRAATTATQNIGLGGLAGRNLTTGGDNVFVGHSSGTNVTTGSQNIILGSTSAATLTTGSNNIIIGYNVDAATAADANTINIGGAIKVANVGTTNDVTFPGSFINKNITVSSSAQTANTTAVYAAVPGLSATVVPGTYRFVCKLPSTVASGTGGIKYSFLYTTTVLSSIESTARAFTASAVATQHTTTATSSADLLSSATIVIFTEIDGTMVVTTGGTVALQMAQSVSNASNSVTLVGATMELTRIA